MQKELKEVKLDIKLEKRETEKKNNLITYMREKEAKIKDTVGIVEKEKSSLEKELCELKTALENMTAELDKLRNREEKLEKQTSGLKKVKEEKSELMIEIRKLKTDASIAEDKYQALSQK